MHLFVPIAFRLQKLVLRVSYRLHRRRPTISWVVGPSEIASMVHFIRNAIPRSYSTVLSRHAFYDHAYDYVPRAFRSDRASYLWRVVAAPWALGRLMRRAEGFIYVGSEGFLLDGDNREFEFSFLTAHGKKLVCYFTGDDIRAPRLMHELESQHGRLNASSIAGQVNPLFETDEYDELKRRIAYIADTYADAVFSAPVDQLGYVTAPILPFSYFLPDEMFQFRPEKFDSPDRIRIVHAPSSPTQKGTAFVRAAIADLRSEGYEFEYIELMDASNSDVLRELGLAHIVLNQFYGYVPGIFGVEAMASTCVMVCSADERLEPILAAGGNKAWVLTELHEILANTRRLLDNPSTLKSQAEAGYRWSVANATASASGNRLREQLDALLASGRSN